MEVRKQQGTPSTTWKIDMFPWHDPSEKGNSAKEFITREIDSVKFDGDYGEPVITYEDELNEDNKAVRRYAILTFNEPCAGKAVAQLKVV